MTSRLLDIVGVPIFKDNYIWVMINTERRTAIAVDPGEASALERYLSHQKLTLESIWVTHHHFDHTQGILELLSHHSVPVYGPHNPSIQGLTHPLKEPDSIFVPMLNYPVQILDIPGHTLDHIAYYFNGMLFCGDTLFSAGCGRVFEGTMAEMFQSLQKIAALPDDTQVYCTHEYTLSNLEFASMIEPHNPEILNKMKEVTALRAENRPTIPTSIAEEKNINPFLRCHVKAVIERVAHHLGHAPSNPLDVFQCLREWKNQRS